MKYVREMTKAPFEILGNLYRYRHILVQMISGEIKGRFAGSVGGLMWNFVHPIMMLIAYLFVFVYIFKLRVGGSESAGASAVYIMAGLFPWVILSEGLLRGTASVIENANLIQKTYFPTEILTAKAVIAPLFSYGVAIALLGLYRVIFDGFFQIILILPLILIMQLLFALGISLLSAAFSVFFRDIVQLMHVILSFWIFLTPVLYPAGMLPEWSHSLMYINPVFPFVSVYQSLFIYGYAAQPHMILLILVWSLVFFAVGSFVFNKLKHEFADWL